MRNIRGKTREEHNEGKRQVEEMGSGLGKPDEGSDHGRFQPGGELVEWKVESNKQDSEFVGQQGHAADE